MADDLITSIPDRAYEVEFEGHTYSVLYDPGFPGSYWEPPEPEGIDNIYLKVEGGWVDLEIDLLEERVFRGIEKALHQLLDDYWEAHHTDYAESLVCR